MIFKKKNQIVYVKFRICKKKTNKSLLYFIKTYWQIFYISLGIFNHKLITLNVFLLKTLRLWIKNRGIIDKHPIEYESIMCNTLGNKTIILHWKTCRLHPWVLILALSFTSCVTIEQVTWSLWNSQPVYIICCLLAQKSKDSVVPTIIKI